MYFEIRIYAHIKHSLMQYMKYYCAHMHAVSNLGHAPYVPCWLLARRLQRIKDKDSYFNWGSLSPEGYSSRRPVVSTHMHTHTHTHVQNLEIR